MTFRLQKQLQNQKQHTRGQEDCEIYTGHLRNEAYLLMANRLNVIGIGRNAWLQHRPLNTLLPDVAKRALSITQFPLLAFCYGHVSTPRHICCCLVNGILIGRP